MKQVNVTVELMEWMSEHWGWFGALLAVVFKFGQDHLRITRLQEDMTAVSNRLETIEKMEIKRADSMARIETKIDFLVNQVKDNSQDIKGIQSK